VLIAGKGHETYQEIRGRRLPFSDSEVVRRVIEKRVCA
jgi:UDP-N-acetylmuramyl tripeptide synthase